VVVAGILIVLSAGWIEARIKTVQVGEPENS